MHYIINLPCDRDIIERLNIGDTVEINGIIVTSRDRAHKFYYEAIAKGVNNGIISQVKKYIRDGAIYHCGPIINTEKNMVISAGPTTSIREEPYEEKVIEFFLPSLIIGKGGMGEKTLDALNKYRSAYISFIGGAGSFYAKNMEILDVLCSDFGMPEAIWVLKVKNLFGIVTMDSKKNNLHEKIKKDSEKIYENLIEKV